MAKVFTVEKAGGVTPGCPLREGPNGLCLQVGEEGRGRSVGRLPVPPGAQVEDVAEGYGKPVRKLLSVPIREDAEDPNALVVVVRDQSGFRGGWDAKGPMPDASVVEYIRRNKAHDDALYAFVTERDASLSDHPGSSGHYNTRSTEDRADYVAAEAALQAKHGGHDNPLSGGCPACKALPEVPQDDLSWRVLTQGECAQGDAGRMGGGPEYAAVLRDGEGFRIRRFGRLYDAPDRLNVRNQAGTLMVETDDEIVLRLASQEGGAW